MGRDWVCTRTIIIDDWVTLNRAKGADWYSVYKDHNTRLWDFKHSVGEGLGVYKDHSSRL